MRLSLMLAAFLIAPHLWVGVKDGYTFHDRLVVKYHDNSQRVVGDVYEVEPGDIRGGCADGPVQTFASRQDGRSFVIAGCN